MQKRTLGRRRLVGTSRLAHLEENVRTIEKGPLDPNIMHALRSSFLEHGTGTGWRAQT